MNRALVSALAAVLLCGVFAAPALAHIGHDAPPPPPPTGDLPPKPFVCPPTAFCNEAKNVEVTIDTATQLTKAFTLANVFVHMVDDQHHPEVNEEIVFKLHDLADNAVVFTSESHTNKLGLADLYNGKPGVEFALVEGKQYRWVVHTHDGDVTLPPITAKRPEVLVADGQGWEAPIVAAPAAITTKQIILLSNGDQAAPETKAWLAAKQVTPTATIGAASKAHQAKTTLTGANGAELSLNVAKAYFTKPTKIGFATAAAPTDAMVASPFLGDAPILLVDKTLSDAQRSWVSAQAAKELVIFGGKAAIDQL